MGDGCRHGTASPARGFCGFWVPGSNGLLLPSGLVHAPADFASCQSAMRRSPMPSAHSRSGRGWVQLAGHCQRAFHAVSGTVYAGGGAGVGAAV